VIRENLSIPSPDSTERRLKSSTMVRSTFNSFTGFHIDRFRLHREERPDFQFLHRIPPSPHRPDTCADSATAFNSFTGFHKEYRLMVNEMGRSAFNSFTGFHGPDIRDDRIVRAVNFQFLHRIPRTRPRALSRARAN